MAQLAMNEHSSILRVLVAEDHAAFRTLVCAILRERQRSEEIFEASDGFEAVQIAQELQPDLIIMDIGLPKLNGIEAARTIREVSIKSRVLFLSLDSSNDTAQQALASGAAGFVSKLKVARDLVAAMDAVLRGERFLSAGLTVSNLPPAHTANESVTEA